MLDERIDLHLIMKEESIRIAKKYLRETLTLFSDRIFREVSANKDFVTELLRVFLDDKGLEVIELQPQKELVIYNQRGVILDCYCKLSDGKLVNIEVENNFDKDKCDHQRRVRYYSSMINVKNLSPSEDFSDLPDLYMIYLTRRDFLKQRKTVYHVERQIEETKLCVNNGYHEIYINAEVDDKSDVSEVMKIMSTPDYVNESFKTITKTKEEKTMPKEVEEAFADIRNYDMAKGRAEGKAEGRIETYITLLKQGLISEEVALSNLKLSKEELENKIKELQI